MVQIFGFKRYTFIYFKKVLRGIKGEGVDRRREGSTTVHILISNLIEELPRTQVHFLLPCGRKEPVTLGGFKPLLPVPKFWQLQSEQNHVDA